MTHALKMLVGCLVPLILIFLLPVLGVSGDITTLVFLGLMFVCHLLVLRGHDHGHHDQQTTPEKEVNHDRAQS